MGLLEKLKKKLNTPPAGLGRGLTNLPDPSQKVENRGPWDEASLTDVRITELVKKQIKSGTSNWQR